MSRSETDKAQEQTSQQQSNKRQTPQQSGAIQLGGQSEQGRNMARRGSPSLFSINPIEFFATSPFDLMRRFSEEMGRAFDEFGLAGTSRTQGGTSQMAAWIPAVEVFERGDNLVVRAELPGVDKKDVRVEMTDDGLIIEGERKEEHEENREGFYRSERVYGRFYRLIPLPENIDEDQVRAEFNNGMLEITIPVPQSQQRRREIPIGAEGGQQSQAASAQKSDK